MTMFKPFVAAALVAAMIGAPVDAQKARRGEQDAAFQATRNGAVRSLRSIENEIVPDMKRSGADYIGAEFDEERLSYRLKFMRKSRVIWLDVDGPSGAIKGKAGE